MVFYDVIILGGGTAGCSTAWNCAKLGLKTLLIEKKTYLGGTMTAGLVVPVMKSGENQINTDFYTKLTARMHAAGGQVTYQNNHGWFNPIILKSVLEQMLLDVGVNIQYNTLSVSNDKIHTDNNLILGVDILSEYIEAKYFIDATGNLDFCKELGCHFLPQPEAFQPMSLRFIMSGIDLDKFAQWLLRMDNDREVTTVEYINSVVHLSTAYTWDSDKNWALAPLFDGAVSKNIIKDTDRNYFQVFSIAGMPDSLAFNCPRIVENLNPNIDSDIQKAYEIGKAAIYRLEKFCKIYFPGFENSYVSKIADQVGIRASRQIRGKYIYTIDDLRSGKKFKHPAVISNYPVDVHSGKKDSSRLEKTGEYQLPIESLMSIDYDNLFVAGRGLSADSLAQGALRVQASCFSMGEAVAKYLAAIG
ncbi:FAD-dependent oxidoreductase [bacterium]|nr:FAD-dependent oxidoreductase [bacterium]